MLTPAEIDETVAEIRITMAMLRRWLDRELSSIPVTIEDGGVVGADGTMLLDLGAPALDRQWDVRRINVSPQDPETTSNAVAWIYRGNGVRHPMMYVDRTKTVLPEAAPWQDHQFTLRPGESLFVKITGGTAGARMFGSAQVVEEIVDMVPERDGRGFVSRLVDWLGGARAVS